MAASAQSEGKSTLGESDKKFIDSLKGTTVEVGPTTGNVNTQALLDKMDELITATNAPSKIDIKKGSIQKKIISEQQ